MAHVIVALSSLSPLSHILQAMPSPFFFLQSLARFSHRGLVTDNKLVNIQKRHFNWPSPPFTPLSFPPLPYLSRGLVEERIKCFSPLGQRELRSSAWCEETLICLAFISLVF